MTEAAEPETQAAEAPETEGTPEPQPETEAAATQPATDGEPVVTDTPAAEGGSRDEILPLLQSASSLVTADVAANKTATTTLLTQAKEKADSDYRQPVPSSAPPSPCLTPTARTAVLLQH